MPIKLTEILKESNDDLIEMLRHLSKQASELEKISPGNELLEYWQTFWNNKIVPWYNEYHVKGEPLPPEAEEKFKDLILDWINHLSKEIKAIQK